MATLPNPPSSYSLSPTAAQLNSLSYAVSFLSNQSVRPTWKVYKSSGISLVANSWNQPSYLTIVYESDNSFVNAGIATIQTQGFYATECSFQVQDLTSNIAQLAIAFLITIGQNNALLDPGQQVWYGYRANGTGETTGGAVPQDDALTASDITPVCLFPGDTIQPVIISDHGLSVDPLANTNFINARFVFGFTGYWVGVGSSSAPAGLPPPPPPPSKILQMGIDQSNFSAMQSVVPGTNAARFYQGAGPAANPNGLPIPLNWPSVAGFPSVQNITYTIYPNLYDLLNNTKVADNGSGFTTTFQQVQALAQKAQPGNKLSMWQEEGTLVQSNPMLTPQNCRSSHVQMQKACSGTNAKYGPVLFGNIANNSQYIPNAPYAMDWYGIDIYDNKTSNNGSSFENADGSINQGKVNSYLNQYLALAKQRTGLKNPHIDVCESNSPTEANRPPFYTYVAEWLYNNGGTDPRMLLFFRCGHNSSGCWDPADTNTINQLNVIVNTYG